MRTVILATNNKEEVKYFQAYLGTDFEVKTLKDFNIIIDPKEKGKTDMHKALIKARATREEVVKRGINAIVVAEDLALNIDALLPDSFDADFSTVKYSGDKNRDTSDYSNNIRLLKKMQGVSKRTARYTCVMCLILENGCEYFFAGHMDLIVGTEIHHGTGFAYDFVLISKDYNKYVCSLTTKERYCVSHKVKAICKASNYLLTAFTPSTTRKRIAKGTLKVVNNMNVFHEDKNGTFYAVVLGGALLSTPTNKKEIAQKAYHHELSYTEGLHLYTFRK